MRHWKSRRWGLAATLLAAVSAGCSSSRNDVSYLGEPGPSYYRDHATEIEFPAVESPMDPQVADTPAPITVRDDRTTVVKDITLAEAIQTALTNSEIIRTAGTLQQSGNLLTNPNQVSSAFDPAIQESGVLFGGRGVEAALAAFDAQLQTSMIWGRDEQAQNNQFFGGGVAGGNALVQETGNFGSSLSKTFANGASVSLYHNINYRSTNSPSLFPSAYTGNAGIQYQLPLLAGSGSEFTRIAGPIGQSFGGISGVSQGVVIARINTDIALADFEIAVRDLVQDVENAYWDLYLAYQRYHIAVKTRQSTYEIMRTEKSRFDLGATFGAEFYQAEDQYYAALAASKNSQAGIYSAEIQLRRLMGQPTGDGEVLRPVDGPTTAPFELDWRQSLTEALTQRVELRRQQWNVKSLQLQLTAAESLVQPRLDFVGGYNVNGFGDNLIGYNEPYLGNFYDTLGANNLTGWNLGFMFNWNIGLRSAQAQVRNYELRLAKAEKVMFEQQKEISHELGLSFQEIARTLEFADKSYQRIRAVTDEIRVRATREKEGADDVDLRLRAIIRSADAEATYYQNLIDYNKAITTFELRKGTLLQNRGVILAEGGWDAEAYADAAYNNKARVYAESAELPYHAPASFSVDAPFNGVYFTDPEVDSPDAIESMQQLPTPVPVPSDDAPPPPEVPQPQASPMDEAQLPSPNEQLTDMPAKSVVPAAAMIPPVSTTTKGATSYSPQPILESMISDMPADQPQNSPANHSVTTPAERAPSEAVRPIENSLLPNAPEPLERPQITPPSAPSTKVDHSQVFDLFTDSYRWKSESK